jgi:hypothetical protein
MAGETLAFADAFDNTYILKHDLQRILGQEVPLLMLTDSQALFYVITGCNYTTEKRFMVEFSMIRESYKDRTIKKVALFAVTIMLPMV